jgi:hypothetical protein
VAKKKSTKLPKRIAGVKIPKKMRKQGGEFLARVNTPLGRELLAAGLVAAGAAMSKRDTVRKAAATAADEVEEVAEDAAAKGARVASQIGSVIGAAANAAMDRLFGPEGVRETEPQDSPAAEGVEPEGK